MFIYYKKSVNIRIMSLFIFINTKFGQLLSFGNYL